MIAPVRPASDSLRVAALFAGIGGIELGLSVAAGHETALFCEIDDSARRVLRTHFPGVRRQADIRGLVRLPRVDLVAAGFPCQDLSQAGRTEGILGARSGLVEEVFRLVGRSRFGPRWLLLENVPFMLRLDRGRAMHYLTTRLEDLGYAWAYRLVDSRAYGLPQRRQRVILLASKTEDPRAPLLGEDAGAPTEPDDHRAVACGFYWTEGYTGLGWAVDAVPTLKSGSTVGIPSPPAVWLPDGRIGTPDIRDSERLQGFPADWTLPAVPMRAPRHRANVRWRLVGNAVSVPIAVWLGERLHLARSYDASTDQPLSWSERWPDAAWGRAGKVHRAAVSPWPVRQPRVPLHRFLQFPLKPLSLRATDGFLSRASRSSLRFPDGLLSALRAHRDRMAEEGVHA